jgi:hypothetical protein
MRPIEAVTSTASPVTAPTVPAFLILGSPRAGTTLVQRLASELPGVAIPPETHFLTHLAQRVLALPRPLGPEIIRSELQRYLRLRVVRGLDLDVDAVIRDLGGTCSSPMDLFASMLRTLCGDAQLIGEKTPMNLLWWRPVTRALPSVRLVGVVRDPRAVVASNLAVRWGPSNHAELAEWWSVAHRVVGRAAPRLGPDRFLLLTYEEVVADPDAARASLAMFLGLDTNKPVAHREELSEGEGASPRESKKAGYLPWETWKQGAWGPITADRIDAWRSTLSPRQASEVAAICRTQMLRFGYLEDVPGRWRALRQLSRLSLGTQARRIRFRIKWSHQARKIERLEL